MLCLFYKGLNVKKGGNYEIRSVTIKKLFEMFKIGIFQLQSKLVKTYQRDIPFQFIFIHYKLV